MSHRIRKVASEHDPVCADAIHEEAQGLDGVHDRVVVEAAQRGRRRRGQTSRGSSWKHLEAAVLPPDLIRQGPPPCVRHTLRFGWRSRTSPKIRCAAATVSSAGLPTMLLKVALQAVRPNRRVRVYEHQASSSSATDQKTSSPIREGPVTHIGVRRAKNTGGVRSGP